MKRNLLLALILIVTIVFIGCRGSQQNKLIGVWEEIPFKEPGVKKTFWQFYAGDALWVFDVDTTSLLGDTVKLDTFTYNIDGNTFEIFGEGVYIPGSDDPRGEYWVDELNKEYFKITKIKHPVDSLETGAYLRIELVKR